MSTDRRSVKITGGTFQGSAIGIGHTEQHGATFGPEPDLADLRTLLAEAREQILAGGADDDKRARIAHELREIDEELAADKPDGPAVRTRWNAVLKVLGYVPNELVAHLLAHQSAISSLVITLTFD